MKRKKSPNQVMPAIVRKPVEIKITEEPPCEIDTEKAVAFGMNLALQMKKNQSVESKSERDDESSDGKARRERYSKSDLLLFKKRLQNDRAVYVAKTTAAQDDASLDDVDNIEPDGGDGSSQTMRLSALNRLERTNRLINDIDDALRRIEDGTYGVCQSCGRLIASLRLMHSPFVRTCTCCQAKFEGGHEN